MPLLLSQNNFRWLFRTLDLALDNEAKYLDADDDKYEAHSKDEMHLSGRGHLAESFHIKEVASIEHHHNDHHDDCE